MPSWALAQYNERLTRIVSPFGFLRGRRDAALRGDPEFFTLYEAEALEVLIGPDYTGRLDNPTPER